MVYDNTVDGRNPAPPGIYKTLLNNGINYQTQVVCRISEPATVWSVVICLYVNMMYGTPGPTLSALENMSFLWKKWLISINQQTFAGIPTGGW